MKIGILSTGNIGAVLTRRLSATGHPVKVANSRGPETIPAKLSASGGQAVHVRDVVTDVDALIVSVPLHRVPEIKPLCAQRLVHRRGLPDA
jgi:predicted dinucleotide-binding enzyme